MTMDKEVLNLCNAMNGIRGIETFCMPPMHMQKRLRYG